MSKNWFATTLFHAIIKMSCLVMFQSVVLLRKIFKTALAFLHILVHWYLLGKVTNLATYQPNIKLNLAIQALVN